MKKIISIIIVIALLMSFNFATSQNSIGDKIGEVLYTDIITKINGVPVDSFNINGSTAVYVSSVKELGYKHIWNNDKREVIIMKDPNNEPSYNEMALNRLAIDTSRIGEKIDDVLFTDIKTKINGLSVESFNINGNTAIYVSALKSLGAEIKWLGDERIVQVTNAPKTEINKIEPPNNVYTVDIKSHQAFINWTDVPEADYYHFYFQKNGESNYWFHSEPNNDEVPEKISWKIDYSKALYEIEPDTNYNIIVTSVKNGIESNDSEILTFKTKPLDLTPIKNLTGGPISSSEALLMWEKRKIADYYHIYWKNSNTNGFEPILNTSQEPLRYDWQSLGVIIKYLPEGEVTEFKILGVVDDVKTQWSDNYAIKTLELIKVDSTINEESFLEDKLLLKSGELFLYSSDGTYLGKLTTNKYDLESIFNEFGSYGSEFSSTSIWNEFSQYGSKFSNKSAFNEFAYDPPYMMLDGEEVGRLTVNEFVSGAISPIGLYQALEELGY